MKLLQFFIIFICVIHIQITLANIPPNKHTHLSPSIILQKQTQTSKFKTFKQSLEEALKPNGLFRNIFGEKVTYASTDDMGGEATNFGSIIFKPIIAGIYRGELKLLTLNNDSIAEIPYVFYTRYNPYTNSRILSVIRKIITSVIESTPNCFKEVLRLIILEGGNNEHKIIYKFRFSNEAEILASKLPKISDLYKIPKVFQAEENNSTIWIEYIPSALRLAPYLHIYYRRDISTRKANIQNVRNVLRTIGHIIADGFIKGNHDIAEGNLLITPSGDTYYIDQECMGHSCLDTMIYPPDIFIFPELVFDTILNRYYDRLVLPEDLPSALEPEFLSGIRDGFKIACSDQWFNNLLSQIRRTTKNLRIQWHVFLAGYQGSINKTKKTNFKTYYKKIITIRAHLFCLQTFLPRSIKLTGVSSGLFGPD